MAEKCKFDSESDCTSKDCLSTNKSRINDLAMTVTLDSSFVVGQEHLDLLVDYIKHVACAKVEIANAKRIFFEKLNAYRSEELKRLDETN